MLVTVETQNKKCIVETEYWYCWKDDVKDDLIELEFTEEEVNGLNDKKLALAQRLLGLGSKEETLKYLLPEQKPKTVVQKVTSAVNSVTPTLNKKVTKEETSDEAVLADDSE